MKIGKVKPSGTEAATYVIRRLIGQPAAAPSEHSTADFTVLGQARQSISSVG